MPSVSSTFDSFWELYVQLFVGLPYHDSIAVLTFVMLAALGSVAIRHVMTN